MLQRVEKVLMQKIALPCTLRRLREIELNFVFLRAGAVQWYCPPSKKTESATPHKHLVNAAFNCLYVCFLWGPLFCGLLFFDLSLKV